MVGVSCFISQSAEKGFPFFKILRKGARFSWTEEAQQAFDERMKFLANLPLLTKHGLGEPLIPYISTERVAVSSVLLREEAGQINMSIISVGSCIEPNNDILIYIRVPGHW